MWQQFGNMKPIKNAKTHHKYIKEQYFVEEFRLLGNSNLYSGVLFLYLWYTICLQYCMKHLYLIVFFLFVSYSYAQNGSAKGYIDGFKLYPNPVTNNKVYINTAQNAAKKILIFDV